ncbi:hypothetical protein [Rhodococcus sp. 3-2]|uniref:hypothetical protein n=1 Tax=Rhodococcus sp. 3-2 TaxID=2890836 RepID=UPI001D180A89|nr:hypothetical protein [Rhodococcus sp. 3-2]MCC4300444.1 hypothetical protein [Rhodococcus sp. 3-2]
MSGTVKVKFIKDRGRRKEGDVVSYDDVSAAFIVEEERAAEYVDDSPVEAPVPVVTTEVTTVAAAPPKVARPPKSDES